MLSSSLIRVLGGMASRAALADALPDAEDEDDDAKNECPVLTTREGSSSAVVILPGMLASTAFLGPGRDEVGDNNAAAALLLEESVRPGRVGEFDSDVLDMACFAWPRVVIGPSFGPSTDRGWDLLWFCWAFFL
jgi:hypothetical protein